MAEFKFTGIHTKTKRDALPVRTNPYWEKISKGRFIGYRKGIKGGSYVARFWMDDTNKRKTIGSDNQLTYDEALAAVIAWCDGEDEGAHAPYTLDKCIDDYCKKLEVEKTYKVAKHTGSRLRKHLPDSMLKKDVTDLNARMITTWRDSMVRKTDDEELKRKSRDSANRVWTMLRAALNYAYELDAITSNDGWSKVKSFKNTKEARKLFLTDKQVATLMDACDKPLRALTRAAVLTGARYMELGNAKVRDLEQIPDTDGHILKLAGKTGERDCYLSPEGATFFKKQAKSKLPGAPLLSKADGMAWQINDQTRPMREAVKRGKLPRETVFYSLRHYYISKAMLAGVSGLIVARNCGTSPDMINKHYAKFQPKDITRILSQVELG